MKKKKKKVVQRLETEVGFSRELAVAFIRSKGRCEYCGADLLMNRQGYASAELDHLLPKSTYRRYASDPRNLVLACRTCNGVKRDAVILGEGENAEDCLAEKREELIGRARKLIARRMGEYDKDWRRATEILHDCWWRTEDW